MTLHQVIDDEILGNDDVSHAHIVNDRIIVITFKDGSSGTLLRSPYSGWYWRGADPLDAATATGMYDRDS